MTIACYTLATESTVADTFDFVADTVDFIDNTFNCVTDLSSVLTTNRQQLEYL